MTKEQKKELIELLGTLNRTFKALVDESFRAIGLDKDVDLEDLPSEQVAFLKAIMKHDKALNKVVESMTSDEDVK